MYIFKLFEKEKMGKIQKIKLKRIGLISSISFARNFDLLLYKTLNIIHTYAISKSYSFILICL